MAVSAPLFSIIVPVYQVEPFLRPCADSILGQSFPDFEVIFVDDGSPDRCGEICDGYAYSDRRVKVVHKQNGGLVSARKAGLAVCEGRYVINVDGDDYIAPDLLERIAAVLSRYGALDAVLYGAVRFSDSFQTPMRNRIPEGLYAGDAMRTIRENLIHDDAGEQPILYSIWAMAVERQRYCACQNAVPTQISRGEDLMITAPLLAGAGAVYQLDYCGYFYRSNPTSIMNTFRPDEVRQMKAAAAFLTERMGQDYRAKIDQYVAAHYFEFLDRAMLQGGYQTYRRLIRDTLDEEIMAYLRRARCPGSRKVQLIFALMRFRCFGVLWLLRRIKKRSNGMSVPERE